MTTSNTPMIVSKISQEGLVTFHRQCYQMLNQQWNIREQMRFVDLAYIREQDWTKDNQRAKISNRYGDVTRYQDVTVPVVLPQVESAVTYQTATFLQGNPIFGVVATPDFEDEATQMEAILADNSTRGGWQREFILFFRDGFKYNLHALEVDWKREVTPVLETDLSFSSKIGKPKEVIWEGNTIKRMDMYNTFFDARVAPTEIHKKGEFAGYTEIMSRIQLKDFINKLPDKMVDNIRLAFESGFGAEAGGVGSGGIESYYLPDINPTALMQKNPRASMDWNAWAGLSNMGNKGSQILYKNIYEVTTLYGRILPSEFSLRVPAANTPQVWKLIVVNHQILIYAERQTNAHGFIPIIFGQPLEDGLQYQTKSLAMNVEPIQHLSSSLMAASVAARRRAISDRGLYDPSRVTEANINADNPSAKIPIRPAAYGKPLNEAYFPIPFRDDQSQYIMQELQQLQQFGNIISGRNQAQQGQFVKGNKTLHEYEDIMSHANGRDQMTAMMIETQIMTPVKLMLKLNILQYQGGTSLYSPGKNKVVNIDPVALRKAVINFKVSDGLLPSDKLINADSFQNALTAIANNPQIGAAYNIGPMFSYLMKTQGAEITEFEKSPQQQAYEAAVQQWQQTVEMMVKQNPQITQQQFPPQPIPANYGYIPGAPTNKQGSPPQSQTPQITPPQPQQSSQQSPQGT